MLPIFFLPAWESDATLRAAIEQSASTTVNQLGETAVLTGGELTLDARTTDPAATYTALAHGFYARLFDIAPSSGIGLPADNVEADVDLTGAWQPAPTTLVNLDLRGYMATALGVRAFDQLAARDPFLRNRLEYTLADTLGVSTAVTKRTSLSMTGQYVQMGALAADDASAVGVDMHEGIGDLIYNIEVTPVDVLSPELRYSVAHYYHALLDLQLDRGPANIQTASALLGVTHTFSRNFSATITGGATVATSPPVLNDPTPVVAPEVRLLATYNRRRWRATLAYAYSYQSLGPAIGYGREHSGTFEVAYRPVDGARWRDLMVHGIITGSAGDSPISADPVAANQPNAPPPQATIYSQSAAAGLILEYPLRRGIAMLTGFDFELTNGTFSPAPPTGSPGLMINAVAMIGLSWTISTDPIRTVRRDPEDEADDARRTTEIKLRPGYDPTPPPEWSLPVPEDRGREALPDRANPDTPVPRAEPQQPPSALPSTSLPPPGR